LAVAAGRTAGTFGPDIAYYDAQASRLRAMRDDVRPGLSGFEGGYKADSAVVGGTAEHANAELAGALRTERDEVLGVAHSHVAAAVQTAEKAVASEAKAAVDAMKRKFSADLLAGAASGATTEFFSLPLGGKKDPPAR
jgi:hypothetical protein